MLSIIIPANNEEGYIERCLDALLAQEGLTERPDLPEVIVAANACTDATVEMARSKADAFAAMGWRFTVLDLAQAGKINALNQADAVARGGSRLYIDADVICSPGLVFEVDTLLDRTPAVYVGATLVVAPAKRWVTRQYARLWQRLPFMQTGVQGAGVFGVNVEGRRRWGAFPDIIADDAFVRLKFTPAERIKADATYLWPMTEGARNLIRVRSRQDQGGIELADRYPELQVNESKPPVCLGDHRQLFFGQPMAYIVYIAISLAVRFRRARTGNSREWSRGR